VVEVKGQALLNNATGRWQQRVIYPKAEKLLAERGERFLLITEAEVRAPRLRCLITNAELLLRFRNRVGDVGLESRILEETSRQQKCTGLSLLAIFPASERLLALVSFWRLVAHGRLSMRLNRIVDISQEVVPGAGFLDLRPYRLPWHSPQKDLKD